MITKFKLYENNSDDEYIAIKCYINESFYEHDVIIITNKNDFIFQSIKTPFTPSTYIDVVTFNEEKTMTYNFNNKAITVPSNTIQLNRKMYDESEQTSARDLFNEYKQEILNFNADPIRDKEFIEFFSNIDELKRLRKKKEFNL